MGYYIEGDAARAEEIKAAFKKLGYNSRGFDFSCGFFYTVERDVHYCCLFDCIANLIKNHPDYKELKLPVEPKFKAEDRIVSKSDKSTIYRIIALHEEFQKYIVDIEHKVSYESCPWISFEDQDDYELAPKPHYDIKNFKPFDKVLIRVGNKSKWTCDFFSHYHKGFHCVGCDDWSQCIPYNDDTKHLLGTTDMPSEEYINW